MWSLIVVLCEAWLTAANISLAEWPHAKANWVGQGDCRRHFSEGGAALGSSSHLSGHCCTHIVYIQSLNLNSINQSDGEQIHVVLTPHRSMCALWLDWSLAPWPRAGGYVYVLYLCGEDGARRKLWSSSGNTVSRCSGCSGEGEHAHLNRNTCTLAYSHSAYSPADTDQERQLFNIQMSEQGGNARKSTGAIMICMIAKIWT